MPIFLTDVKRSFTLYHGDMEIIEQNMRALMKKLRIDPPSESGSGGG